MASISCQVNEPDAIQMLFFFRNNNELFQKISTQQQAAGSRQQAAASQFERRLGKQKQQENKTKKPKAKVQTKVKSPKVGEIAMFAHAAKDVHCMLALHKAHAMIISSWWVCAARSGLNCVPGCLADVEQGRAVTDPFRACTAKEDKAAVATVAAAVPNSWAQGTFLIVFWSGHDIPHAGRGLIMRRQKRVERPGSSLSIIIMLLVLLLFLFAH